MTELLSINNTAFTVLSYPMSYIELFGVIFNLLCVILVARKNIVTWPVGIIGALLFIAMFWQIQLFSDAILNIYFVVTGFMGWWMWSKRPAVNSDTEGYGYSSQGTMVLWAFGVLAASLLWGTFMSHANSILPGIFTMPASFPYWDGAILIASFAAQWLMMHKRTECWVYWISIDVVAIVLYWVKDIKFTSLLYVVFLGMATYGLVKWSKTKKVTIH